MNVDTQCRSTLINAVGYDLLPPGLPYTDQFRLAAAAGFQSIEMPTVTDPRAAEAIKAASEETGLKIHSVLIHLDGSAPAFSGDDGQTDAAVAMAAASLRNAVLWGADTVLLIPGKVSADVSFEEARRRSTRVIRERILPLAEDLRIVLGLENIWHSFLLSPAEYVQYIDDFESPWVRAYLDVGNMVFGHPEHWVRAAGGRIVRLHLKDFRFEPWGGTFRFGKIGDGAIDWARVRGALREVGFASHATSTGVPYDRAMALGKSIRRRIQRRVGGRLAGTVLSPLTRAQARLHATFLRDVASRFERFEAL